MDSNNYFFLIIIICITDYNDPSSYMIPSVVVIFKQIYFTQNKTLTGTTIPVPCGTGSNGSEEVCHTPQISRNRASSLDVI